MANVSHELVSGINHLSLDLTGTDSIGSMEDVPHYDEDALSADADGMWSDPQNLCDVFPMAKLKLWELYFLWASSASSKDVVERVIERRDARLMETGEMSSPTLASVPRSRSSPHGIDNLQASSSRSIPKSPVTRLIRSTLVFPSSPTIAPGGDALAHGVRNSSPLAGTALVYRSQSLPVSQFTLLDSDFDLGEALTPTEKESPEKDRVVPVFVFPGEKEIKEREEREKELMKSVFSRCQRSSKGKLELTEADVRILIREVIHLPSFLAEIIFEDMGLQNTVSMSEDFLTCDESVFVSYYESRCASKPIYRRLFNLLRSDENAKYIMRENFHRLLDLLLVQHPGLSFLEATPQFQVRYLETVVERLFYTCAKRHPNRLYPRELETGGIVEALMQIDYDEDINSERRFFSYEHFYVLFCRFWELDADHDMKIDAEDLLSYGGHALSCRIVERIFSGVAKPFNDSTTTSMSYTDFIWFCLSEEDKTSERALTYWFGCIDRDGDGFITLQDTEFFYEEQIHRMECLGHEPISFVNVVSQMLDMLEPHSDSMMITRALLRKSKQQSNFFNVLFNINKLFGLEGKDIRAIRNQRETPELTEWDRFALFEYHRLSAEEDTDNVESINF